MKSFYIGEDPSKNIKLTDRIDSGDSNIAASAKSVSILNSRFVNVNYQGQIDTLTSNLGTSNTNIGTNSSSIDQLTQRLDNFNIIPIGNIQLMPFRHNELPTGYYLTNGDNFALSTPQGQVLNGLSANYKSDWNINTTSGTQINVPNLFESNGRGYYLRSVNGTLRQVGSIELSAAPNITGSWENAASGRNVSGVTTGAIGALNLSRGQEADGQSSSSNGFDIDASRVSSVYGRSSTEVRTSNRGMTPTIFLGV